MVGSKISQSRPHTMMIRKLSELLVSGNHRPASATGFSSDSSSSSSPAAAASTSPRSPLDYSRTQSPRGVGLKNFDLGGVGLGIVAALEKSSGYEVLAKHSVCCTPKSDPIPVGRCWRNGGGGGGVDHRREKVIESLEENYTYVTSRRGGGGEMCTKVYYDDGAEIVKAPAAAGDLLEEIEYPSSSFLNCCHLCKKQLQGLDIYMYRGETAFCSSECRSSQITMDEREEKKQKQQQKKCRRELAGMRSSTVSGKTSSPPMFSTGILAI